MAQGEGLSPAWDPPPPDPGLDPWVVLEVDRSARPEVIEAAFGVLREMAARDEQEGARWIVRLNWARRVLTQGNTPR